MVLLRVDESWRMYEDVKTAAVGGGCSILVFVAPTCDAIAACRILTVGAAVVCFYARDLRSCLACPAVGVTPALFDVHSVVLHGAISMYCTVLDPRHVRAMSCLRPVKCCGQRRLPGPALVLKNGVAHHGAWHSLRCRRAHCLSRRCVHSRSS